MSKLNPSSYYIPGPRGKSRCGERRKCSLLIQNYRTKESRLKRPGLACTEMNNVTCTEFDVNVKNMIYYIGYIHGGC